MANQMPPKRQVRCLVHFAKRFLDFVFAEISLAGCGRGPHEFGSEGFGDCDETYRGGVASGAAGRARDAIANAVQPGAERVHYFLS